MELYEGGIVLLGISSFFIIVKFGWKKGWRMSMGLLLLEYVLLVLSSTVIFRATRETACFDYIPFWSYDEIIYGRQDLLVGNFMNVVILIPVGILLGMASSKMTWLKATKIGCGLSVLIEMSQLVFRRGFSEVDDVIHNTIGCMIGYGVYSLVRMVYEKLFERHVSVL